MKDKDRFDIIQYLVGKLSLPGKVKIQKIIYFLQEAAGVDMGYDFVMHYYGPYSFELNETLQEMKSKDILKFSLILYPSGWGYDIKLGENAAEDLHLQADFKKNLNKMLETFSTYDAETMELLASIHFVKSILIRKEKPHDKESIISEVKKLKPKFKRDTIESGYDGLLREGLLKDA